jgi:hypothetical protein
VPELPEAFRRWAKANGHDVEEGRTLYVQAEDRRGALVETLDRIAALGINVDAIECISAGDRFGWFIWTDAEGMSALEELLISRGKTDPDSPSSDPMRRRMRRA